MKRLAALVLCAALLCTSSALAAKKTQEYTAREITTDVVTEIPEKIQQVLDLAYQQWEEVDAQNLKQKNKFTLWRNKYEFGWCGGFVTWCMLEADIPMEEKNKIRDGEVEGLFHVKKAVYRVRENQPDYPGSPERVHRGLRQRRQRRFNAVLSRRAGLRCGKAVGRKIPPDHH